MPSTKYEVLSWIRITDYWYFVLVVPRWLVLFFLAPLRLCVRPFLSADGKEFRTGGNGENGEVRGRW
jgi:hypothetical protein